MTFRPSERPSQVARIVFRLAYPAAALALAMSLSGCPGGADLENPDRFIQYGGAGGTTGGTGGVTGGTGGATGGTAGAQTGGTAGMGAGGTAGSGAGAGGAMAGSGGTGIVPLCDVQVALSKSCARTGCHSALDHYAGLDLSNPANVAALVGKAASFGDINCAMPGTPFRACMPSELPAGCVPGTVLIEATQANFANSWIAKKMTVPKETLNCGDHMPLPPGDSVASGWNDARRDCLLDFFLKHAAP
jgi:hypothetical protein